MKKLFLFTLLLALPLLASAYDIAVENADGVTIYYNYIYDGTELEVTTGYSSYSGEVNIPNEVTYMSRTRKVTTIGYGAFASCEYVTSVTIPNSVTSIGERAFPDCRSLTSITIPNSVTSIGNWAFDNCGSLTSVTIGNSVTSIGHHAFNNCRSLTSVTIPNSVTSIGNNAFYACEGLIAVTIPNSVTSIEKGVFGSCSSLTSVTIPNSVTNIGNYAFRHCGSLTSVTIPNSVTSIGTSAFAYCSGLTSVTIPNSVTSIGDEAFYGCGSLTSVISKMENPCPIGYNCFPDDVFYNVTLYVPKGTTDKYKSTYYWNKFLFIEEGEPGGSVIPDPNKCSTPTISYADKELTFSCETEGVEYVYEIKDTDIKKGYEAKVSLSATYEISVYATKSGYVNSDIATATLVWTEAIFTETTPDTPTSAKAVTESIPVLISAQNGTITVRGEQNGFPLTVYTADGKMLGSATMKDGQASISTNLQRGEIAIVKVGSKSVKIKM